MKPDELMQTIYLGDRGCKSILIDGWNDLVKLEITCVSRVRSATWDFYTDEDLENGKLVFSGVTQIIFDPPGCMPNSYIDVISVKEVEDSLFEFIFSVGASAPKGDTLVASINIHARQLHLEAREGNIFSE